MDQFGIGAGVKGAMEVYFQSSRRTGRTTQLIESLKDGDRVVFANSTCERYFKKLAREHGKTIETVVIEPKQPEKIFEMPTSEGRTIFDHFWLSAFYKNAIDKSIESIDFFQRESSGFGAAHIETRMAMQERDKWRV